MIKVRFEMSDDKKSLILKVEGHAGQDESGHDIVCASASILAYTVAQCVQSMREEGKLKKKPTIRLDSGDAVVVCKPTKNAYAEALHTYSVAQVGYKLLEHNYGNYVQLTMFGEA